MRLNDYGLMTDMGALLIRQDKSEDDIVNIMNLMLMIRGDVACLSHHALDANGYNGALISPTHTSLSLQKP
jgi:hypothetical protein